jgi:hypothetical protein
VKRNRKNQQDTSETETVHATFTHFKATVLPMDVNVYIIKKAPLAACQQVADPEIGTLPDGFPMKSHIERAD